MTHLVFFQSDCLHLFLNVSASSLCVWIDFSHHLSASFLAMKATAWDLHAWQCHLFQRQPVLTPLNVVIGLVAVGIGNTTMHEGPEQWPSSPETRQINDAKIQSNHTDLKPIHSRTNACNQIEKRPSRSQDITASSWPEG